MVDLKMALGVLVAVEAPSAVDEGAASHGVEA